MLRLLPIQFLALDAGYVGELSVIHHPCELSLFTGWNKNSVNIRFIFVAIRCKTDEYRRAIFALSFPHQMSGAGTSTSKSGGRLRAGCQSSQSERTGAILGAHKVRIERNCTGGNRRETYSIEAAKRAPFCALFIGFTLLCMV